MPKKAETIRVLQADVSQGNLLVHFSDETSVLFQAHFLSDVREHDGNITLSNEPEEQHDDEQG